MTETALRQRRKAMGLSIGELAAVVGCSIGSISMWERGQSRPSDEQVAKLAGVLGAKPEELQHEVQAARLAYLREAALKVEASHVTTRR